MLHIDSADRALLMDTVSEDIRPGELVYAETGGGFRLATGVDGRVDGVVEDLADDHIAEHDEDFRASIEDFVYDASEGDRAQMGGGEDRARLRLRTPSDDGTSDPPGIQAWAVVGIADAGTEYDGRIVEEGYSPDGGTTVYDRASGNFLAVGLAAASDPKTHSASGFTEFDGMIHVIRRADL